jgi:glutamine synthetase
MTPDELDALVTTGEIDTVLAAFTDSYGRLLGKRLDARFFLDETIGHGTHACDYLLTVDMEMDPVAGYDYASWELGYGDFHLVADLTTLTRAGWTSSSAIVLCHVVDVATHDPVAVAPRSVLAAQVERATALGFTVEAASELEFFIFEDSYRDAHRKGYADLEPAGWYIEDYHLLQGARVEGYVGAARRALTATGIPVESSKGEWGRGQHELNIGHTDVSTMADRHAVMKHAMKELAEAQGLSVTFMAKPTTQEAGSSSHLHVSLWDAEAGTNVFDAGGERSDVFRWFLGGWMAGSADFMAFYAPTVNSYKRYVDGSWAPTRIAWSQDNRTAGFRVVGQGESLRIECRIPGADCNPYLAYAAALASGLRGVEQRIEPPPGFEGDIYAAAELPRVPTTLEHALDRFATSALVRESLGDAVADHYTKFFRVEVEAHQYAVTDWERRRYFERI